MISICDTCEISSERTCRLCKTTFRRCQNHAAEAELCYPCDAASELIVLQCANCGARMQEMKCKLICECGYFASCSDYY